MNSFILGGVLTILSIIGISSVLLGELNERRKEFGIRIACGANLKTLCKEMILEIFMMVTLSSVLSILFLLFKQLLYTEVQYLGTTTLLLNFIVILILTIIMSFIPILKIRKFSVVDLVKGE